MRISPLKTSFRKPCLGVLLFLLLLSSGCQAAAPTQAIAVATALPSPTLEPSPKPSTVPTNSPSPTPPAQSLGFRNLATSILAADPITPNTLYLLGEDALFIRSSDGGSTWKQMSAEETLKLPAAVLNSFLVSAQALGNNVVQSVFRAGDLSEKKIGGVVPQTPAEVYAIDLIASPSVLKSSDGGQTWNPVSPLPVPDPQMIVIIDPTLPNTLYLSGMSNIYKSNDGGLTWQSSNVGMRTPGPSGYSFARWIFHQTHPAVIYILEPGYAYRSDNSGAQWNELVLPRQNGMYQPIGALFLHPIDANKLYATNAFAFPDARLYQSTDAGVNWAEVNGLPEGKVHQLVIDPLNPDVHYAILDNGKLSGFFMSSDGGATWVEVAAQLLP